MISKRPAPIRESQLLSSVVKRLKARALADPTLIFRKRHGSPMGVSGDPDLYVLWCGQHLEVELKRPGESPTLLQEARLAQWRAAGALTFVVRSLEEFDAALAQIRPRP